VGKGVDRIGVLAGLLICFFVLFACKEKEGIIVNETNDAITEPAKPSLKQDETEIRVDNKESKERARIQKEIDILVDSIRIINDKINVFPSRTVGGKMESPEEMKQVVAAIKAGKLDSLAFGENYHKVDSLRAIIKSYRPRTDSLRSILKELPRYE